jgi:glycerol-3-phosphate O-acyltransferase
MAKELISEKQLLAKVKELEQKIPEKFRKILILFFDCYNEAVHAAGHPSDKALKTLLLFLDLVEEQFEHPFDFEPYHKKVRKPVDYYAFSLDFIRPFIDMQKSRAVGLEHLDAIAKQLKRKENVVLLANHQTETDPQVIAILLEKKYPEIAEKIIYVAGERVVTDPLAIPFSMGCDLLCIYSKRYIDHPPELKAKKQLHNKSTMGLMSSLLKEGGKIIYVAPSGGRDRRNSDGVVEVAPFDPPSIEMFYLMAKKAKTPTHFYPFSLDTYDVMPPPDTIQKELGEARYAKRSSVHLAFAPEFDMDHFPGSDQNDKILRRQARADAIWNVVDANYQTLAKLL